MDGYYGRDAQLLEHPETQTSKCRTYTELFNCRGDECAAVLGESPEGPFPGLRGKLVVQAALKKPYRSGHQKRTEGVG